MWPLMLCLYNTESVGTEWTMTKKTIRNKILHWDVSNYCSPVQASLDTALYKHKGAASLSQALVLMGHFNHTSVCWRDNTAGHKQPRRFLECIDEYFLPIEGMGSQCFQFSPIRNAWWGMWSSRGSPNCSDHEMVEFKVLGAARRAHSKLNILDFRRPYFWDQLDRVPWHKALEEKRSIKAG